MTAPAGVTAPETARERSAQTRARRLVVASTMVITIGMLFGYKIDERLALSNIAQVVGLILLFVAHPRLLRARDVVLILLGLGSVVLAAVSVSLIYGYRADPLHTAYFLAATVYLTAVYRACSERGAGADVAEGVRRSIPPAAAVLLVTGVLERTEGAPFISFGFDDNSHAAVAACFLAFASLRFLRTPLRLILAIAFFAAALLTYSRMPFFFAPFLAIAFAVEYRRLRAEATEAWHVFGAHLLVLAAVAIPVVLARNAAEHFTVFERVLAPGEFTIASTTAHIELLSLGAQLKVDNVWNMLLGVTPGGFAATAVASDIDLTTFAVRDPIAYQAMLDGWAPLHSSLGSVLLEFPAWVAVVFVVVVVLTFVRLLRRREWVMAAFLVGLMAATTLYSSHNEIYFVVSLAVSIAMAYDNPAARRPANGGRDEDSTAEHVPRLTPAAPGGRDG